MRVRIYKPAKTTMQSGFAKAHYWLVEPELPTSRQPEPLMGWTSSGDTLNQLKMVFETSDEAMAFCEKQGWDYVVDKPRARKVVPRSYADNFKFIDRL